MSAQVHRIERSNADWPEIPGYRLEAVLGRGATGVVYRGVQLAVDRDVAVKVLHEELTSKPRVVGRLKREARTLARLHHPHLIAAIDMGAVDGRWWFAMEYVDGPTLADRIRSEGPLSEREALRLFLPLAEALVCLGEAGVVHRDVKPANVLLERGPRGGTVRARLADLGLAFAEDDPQLTAQGGTLGTPHYISPEQTRDPSAVDARTDIWSFGATLFHALCGRPPFTGESMAEVLSAVLHSRVPDPQQLAPHLGRGLALVVRKCLVRDPDGRYPDARALVDDLELLRERRNPNVAVAGLDPLERQPSKLRRAGLVLLVATGLAVGGTSLVLLDPLAPGTGPAVETVDLVREQARMDEILNLAEGDPARLAGALRSVDDLREESSDEVWLPARAELLERIEQQVERLTRDRGGEVDLALAAQDYGGAQVLLELDALGDLVRAGTGFRLEDMPNRARGRLTDWRIDRLRDVDEALAGAADAFRSGIVRYREDVLLPGIERLVDAGAWRSALAETQLGASDLAQRAGLDPGLLPVEELEAATLETRVRLTTERVSIEGRWSPRFRALTGFVEDLGAELTAEAVRLGGLDASRLDLADDLDAELDRRGLDRAELPVGAWEALDVARREAETDLADAVRDASAISAAAGLGLRADVIAPALLARREYEAAAELWREYEASLDAGAAGDVLARVRAERDTAERLTGLLRRAAEAVRERRGERIELDSRNIGVSGELVAGADPLADGFQLRTTGRGGERRYPFDLRTLELDDLRAFLGFDGDPAELSTDDRLALALMLEAESEDDAASEVLDSGATPTDAVATVERLSRRLTAPAAPRRADDLLRQLDGELAERDLPGAAALIDHLLEDRLGDPAVALRSNSLRRDREDLLRALRRGADHRAELAGRYPDGRVEAPLEGRGRVTFDGSRGRTSIDLGPGWRREPGGDPAARAALGWEELAGGAGLSLALEPPFDPRTGPWSAELELDLPAGDPPRALVLRAGGYLVGWAQGGWIVGTGTEAELVAALRAGEGLAAGRPLRAGAGQRLRVEWDRARGTVRVYLDGALVARADRAPLRPAERPRVELRSLDPLVLRSLEIEGPLR